MPETAKQPLPSGPSSLCFNKEDFMREDFNVELFVVECRRKVPLETLRGDLHVYLKILQSAMIELINKDYADFVNLSTNLVGMDKAINNLLNPLNHLKNEILNVRNAMTEASSAIEDKMKQQARVREKKECLKMLMCMVQSVEKMEKLLRIQSSDKDRTPYNSDLNGQLIERVATEFNKLQFYVSKSRGLPLVDDIKPRISGITMTLQYSLEGSFKEGLATGNVDVLRECLRTYATIDKMRDAENLFRTHVVKAYMEETINEQFIRSHPDGLHGMYATVLEFFPKHCSKLLEITLPTGQSRGDMVSGYDFVVNSVWPEVVTNLEARTPSIFAPGNPNVFHEKYTISVEFVDKFERRCGSQASVKRLRAHPSYNTFMSKWSLPVYFQIRFQEIAGALEAALFTPFTDIKDKGCEFKLECTRVAWESLLRCWAPDIYLQPLCHRFWKLSLQLLSRYAMWTGEVQDELSHSASRTEPTPTSVVQQSLTRPTNGDTATPTLPGATPTQPGMGGAVSQPVITMSNIVDVIIDAQTLAKKIPEFFETAVVPQLKLLGNDNIPLLKESVKDSEDSLVAVVPRFRQHITSEITTQCVGHLKSVSDIPRLYRRTNREVPTKASSYVSSVVKPLIDFLNLHLGAILDNDRRLYATAILQAVGEQYLVVTTDVLTSVKKMEESLKRLKAARGTSATGGAQGMSDDDKIRLQLSLDVKEFGHQISLLGLSGVEAYGRLCDIIGGQMTSTS